MIELECEIKDIGKVKLMVGIKIIDGSHTQYCLTKK